MSPQSRGRKRRKQKARGGGEPAGPDALIAQMARDVMRDLESDGDALDAELCVSELWGGWWGRGEGLVDPEVVLGEGLVDLAARRKRPGAVGLLRAVAVLGTDAQREKAAAAADALVARGVDEPAWVAALGTGRVGAVWAYSDVFGDQTSVLLVVERADRRHGLIVLVDHARGGIVKDAFVTADPDAALEDIRTLGADPAVTLREITPEEAAALLVPAFAATDRAVLEGLEPPADEEFAVYRAVAMARLRLLPAPPPAPVPVPPTAAERAAAVAEFLGSEAARDLPAAARGCAERLVAFGAAAEPARPLRVGPGLLDRFLDETLNEGPGLPDDEFDALPATVRAWAEWAGRRTELPEAALVELRETADDMACAIGRPGDAEPVPADVADAYLGGLDFDDLRPEDLPDVLERRMFAAPAVGTRIGSEEFPFLDPSDPDDRGMLIEGEHPEYHDALADPGTDTTVDGVNPRMHVTMHEIVATQLWNDDPPEVWQAARRLLATGMDRHEVLHTIGGVLVKHLWGALRGEPSDPARYVEEVDRLGRPEPGHATVTPLRRKR